MKKTFILTLALLAACTAVQEPSDPVEEGQPLSLLIGLEDLSSKTGYTPESGMLKCSWNAGDTVSVLSLKNGKLFRVDQFVTATGGRTASFEGAYHGQGAESVICVYPPLKGGQMIGYQTKRLPASSDGCYRISTGDNCLTFAGSEHQVLSQAADADAAHLAYTDLMTGVVDLSAPLSGVTMSKHSDVLAVSASIPELGAGEKVRSLTLSLSSDAPFAYGPATLPLSSAGLWTGSSALSSVTLKFGSYQSGQFTGAVSGNHSLTAYIPVLPLEGASSLQGDEPRELTLTVRTDRAVYSTVKTIPAHTTGAYAYGFSGGQVNLISATLPKTADIVTTGVSNPDQGWLFLEEGPYTLTTTVDAAPGSASFQLVRDLSLYDETKPDIVLSTTTTIGTDGELSVPLGMLDPGFYQVRIRNDEVRFMIGVRPDAVLSPLDAKPDFDSFWSSTLAQVDAMPFDDVQWTLVPGYSNEKRQCYEVRYTSWNGATSGGVLSIPVAPGKYQVRMQFLGYGNQASYQSPNNRPGVIDFQVSTRDQGLFKSGTNWDTQGLESKETYYYRGAYCDIKRAINFVMTQLDKADTDHVVAYGSSQGGALSTICAALDPRIKALAPSVPFMSDFPDYYKIARFPMNNDIFPAADAAGIPHSQVLDMLSYFDIKNFAPRIHCPVLMVVGLQDVTCPPHTNFAMYNNLGTTDKRYVILPNDAHTVWGNPLTPSMVHNFLSQY